MQLLQRLASEDAQRPEPLSQTNKRRAPMSEELTPQELEVLRLLAQGRTNPQIARTVLCSVSSVKIHVQNIISKLGVSDRTQAAVRAIELGLATSGLEEEDLQRGRGML